MINYRIIALNYREYIFSIVLIILVPLLTHSNDEDLDKIATSYFNSFYSFRAEFVQEDADNKKQRGSVIILKPNLIKWDYYIPNPITILIKDKWLTYYDRVINEYTYSLITNSLYNFLSYKDVRELKDIKVLKIKHTQKNIHIFISDIKSDNIIEVIFNKSPVFLSEFKILNSAESTNIKFYNVSYNIAIDKSEFVINNDFSYHDFNSLA